MPKSNSRSSTPTSARKRTSTTTTTTTTSSTTPPLTSLSPTSSSKQNKDKDDDIKSKNATITSSSLFSLKCSGGSLILFIFLTILINIGWLYAFTTLKNSGKFIIEDLNERLDQYDICLLYTSDAADE